MDLGPTPSGSETNHTMLGSRPETEPFSLAATMTPRTANGRLHDQDFSFALTSLTGTVIRVDSLTIAGHAVFRIETNSYGPCGALHWEHLLREESPDKQRIFTKGLTTEAICEEKLIHYTSYVVLLMEGNPPKG
jgi:hypothetical protein